MRTTHIREQRGAALLGVMIAIVVLSSMLLVYTQRIQGHAQAHAHLAAEYQLWAALDYGVTVAQSRLEREDADAYIQATSLEDARRQALTRFSAMPENNGEQTPGAPAARFHTLLAAWRDAGGAARWTVFVLAQAGAYERCAEVTFVRRAANDPSGTRPFATELLTWREWSYRMAPAHAAQAGKD